MLFLIMVCLTVALLVLLCGIDVFYGNVNSVDDDGRLMIDCFEIEFVWQGPPVLWFMGNHKNGITSVVFQGLTLEPH
jgi:hypothetical protein